MPERTDPIIDLSQLLERFPGHSARISRLIEQNEPFRSMCEEYALARATLAKFQAAEGELSPEYADYVRLVGELEREIGEVLRSEA